MLNYAVKRLLLMIPTLLVVVLLMYAILDLIPGDPARMMLGDKATPESVAQLRDQMGLNDPFFVRYFRFIGNVAKGDFGTSWVNGRAVTDEIKMRAPVTLTLGMGAAIIGLVVGIPLGIISAVKQNSAIDIAGVTLAVTLNSVPGFWLAMMLIILFSLTLGWLPAYGAGSIKHFIMPWIASSTGAVASQMRMSRTSMLECIRMDYVRTARAKGQRESVVITRHALRNAILPIVTLVGIELGLMLGGSVTIESVFSLPGMGTLLVSGIRSKDVPVVLGSLVVLVAVYAIVMLVVDLSYAFFDPRIKARYLKAKVKSNTKAKVAG